MDSEEFLGALRATFKVEAREHLQAMSAGLLELEKTPVPAAQREVIEGVYRAAHSLKGAARAVDFPDVESICQGLEDMFALWKRGESTLGRAGLDDAHRAVDSMSQLIAAPVAPQPSPNRSEPPSEMLSRSPSATSGRVDPARPPATDPHPGMPAFLSASTPAAAPVSVSAPAPASASASVPPSVSPAAPTVAGEMDTVRVTVRSLDARLLEAEELLTAKFAAGQRAADLGALAGQFEHWRKEWSRIQRPLRTLRQIRARTDEAAGSAVAALAEFVDWNHDYLRALESKVAALRRNAEQDHLIIGKLVDDLLENSKQLLMLPLATLGAVLRKLVRDLCRDQGKEADITIRGEEVKIDKRILEEMKDPLIHVLRNCVDHGVENPEQRLRAGKPPRAAILLAISQVNGNQVEISVSDDGAGIDVEKVKAAAGRRGLLAPEAAALLSESAALALVFDADVSTSPLITRVSGRGLGLAIAREKTEKLGGRVSIQSRRGVGTLIRMTLPLTLATFRGILVESRRRPFVVPTAQVERVTRFKIQDKQTVEGRETLQLDGRAVALADLADVLHLSAAPRRAPTAEAATALILGAGEQRVAFAVDAVLDEREVLVKPLMKPLSRVRNIAGATVLGSGEVAPILNVSDLLKSARLAGGVPRAASPRQEPAAVRRRVLVAEDSITSRMLLKGILESAGYEVRTAVDGVEAFTLLRAEQFDLVVSDVEMPRLNGFDLTARIRADRRLAELPVILVTALESREDRERGIDAGASAYLVKSSLDQSNLLEALRRLI